MNEELKEAKAEESSDSDSIDADTLKGILQDLNLATKDDIEELKARIEMLENN